MDIYEYGRKRTHHRVFIDTEPTLPNGWITNKPKLVNEEDYNAIILTYEELPKYFVLEKEKQRSKHEKMRSRRDFKNHIPITQKMIDDLLALKLEKKCGYQALYRYGLEHTEHEVFRVTTDTVPHHWVIGNTKNANINYYNQIIQTYKSIPDKYELKLPSARTGISYRRSTINHVPVPPYLREKLTDFINTPRQLSLGKVLKLTGAPEDLKLVTLSNIARGRTNSLHSSHLEYIKTLLKI